MKYSDFVESNDSPVAEDQARPLQILDARSARAFRQSDVCGEAFVSHSRIAAQSLDEAYIEVVNAHSAAARADSLSRKSRCAVAIVAIGGAHLTNEPPRHLGIVLKPRRIILKHDIAWC